MVTSVGPSALRSRSSAPGQEQAPVTQSPVTHCWCCRLVLHLRVANLLLVPIRVELIPAQNRSPAARPTIRKVERETSFGRESSGERVSNNAGCLPSAGNNFLGNRSYRI